MIGHLGTRVSALLDGRLPREDEERAWDHVHACHHCRDLVEREGWVKTRLAELGGGAGSAPSGLKGSLLLAPLLPPGESCLAGAARSRPRGTAVAVGSGAVGMAMLGVLLVGAGPASAPASDRRVPVTSVVGPRTGVPGLQDLAESAGRDRSRRQPTLSSTRR